MDLASFIPGVGTTAPFTPGAATPAPFNVAHTGLTDGTGPLDSSKNMAEIYNRILLQIASVIVKSGLTVNNNNWAQLGDAVQALVNGSSQTLSLSGHTLSISGGNSVTLSDADNQTLGISGHTLSISGGNSVSLPDADNQTLSVSGNNLSISGGNSVSLTEILGPYALSLPGYQKFASGLIIQWGQVVAAAGSSGTITLPITFPNTGAFVTISHSMVSNGKVPRAWFISNSQFSFGGDSFYGSDPTGTQYWLAIGF